MDDEVVESDDEVNVPLAVALEDRYGPEDDIEDPIVCSKVYGSPG